MITFQGVKAMDCEKTYKLLQEIIGKEKILVDEPMKNHTSFKIGGPVDFLLLPTTLKEVKDILKVCKDQSIPLFIMGNGSNLLVRDKGVRGVVIKIARNFSDVEINGNIVKAQAGVLLSRLAKLILRKELQGFEFASGIPGTLGGAVTMNAGAYGGEMKDVLLAAEVIDKSGNIYELFGEEMNLGYRQSAIQDKDLIVLNATLELKKGKYEEIKALMEDLDHRRKTKQPLEWPSAGSTFKRPTGYYAGKLVQDVGLKGFTMGRAQVSDLHSGFVINKGNCSATEIIGLIQHIQGKVKDQFGVDLCTEVKIIGEE